MQLSNIFEIPLEIRAKAMQIVTDCETHPSAYMRYKGQRLQHDREIVSVPLMGDKYRMLFRYVNPPNMKFCGACTHQVYDKIIKARNTDSIRPMSALLESPRPNPAMSAIKEVFEPKGADGLPASAPRIYADEPTPSLQLPEPPPDVTRKPRNPNVSSGIETLVQSMKPGETINAAEVMLAVDGSKSRVYEKMAQMEAAGWVKVLAGPGERSYQRVVPPLSVVAPAQRSAADLIAIITDALAQLQAMAKPVSKDQMLASLSDDDLAMETLSRMSARRAA